MSRVKVVVPFRVHKSTTYRHGNSYVAPVPKVKGKVNVIWVFIDDYVRLVFIAPYGKLNAGLVEGSKGRKFFIEGDEDLVRDVLLRLSDLGVDVEEALKQLRPKPEICEYVCPDGSRGKAICGMADMETYRVGNWVVTRHYDPECEFVDSWEAELMNDMRLGVGKPYKFHKEFINSWGVIDYNAAAYHIDDKVVIKAWIRRKQNDFNVCEEQEWILTKK